MSQSDEARKRPLVSVITPSYQQGAFIRETIESVLTQDYPHIEMIVMDGGSRDETVDILRRYARKYGEQRFRYVSERDKGQAHALNKGLSLARGEVIGWLNSDDTYWPKAIGRAVSALVKHPEYGLVYGKADHTDANNRHLRPYPVDRGVDRARLFDVCTMCQPAVFIRKSVLDESGPLDESLHFCMDYDLWIRLSAKHRFGFIDQVLANSRLHDDCKSVKQYFTVGLPEIIRTGLKHYGAVSNHWLIQFIAHHLPEGPAWLMEKMKQFRVFGEGPSVVSSNRFHDGWVPTDWKLEIDNRGGAPVHSLLIRGEHQLPKLDRKAGKLLLTVRVNGTERGRFKLDEGSFKLHIPLREQASSFTVEIESNASFVPAKLGLNDDNRTLSFKASQALPFSSAEARMHELLDEQPANVGEWLMRKRKFKW